MALQNRPGIYALKIHRGRKTLYVSEPTARIIDPICRAELERTQAESAEWALVLRHLAEAGPSSAEDLRVELGLKPKELKKIISPLELCGAVLTRPVEAGAKGEVEGFELARWDQVFPEPAAAGGGIEELVVAGVRAAVVAPEREPARWFAWRFGPDLVDRLVSDGRLERPEPGWLAAPASA